MSTVRVDVAPELLQWAVDRAGWDEHTAVQRVPHLDDWIAGERKPTLKQLEKFAQATHAPFGHLFLAEPPVEEIPIPDTRTLGNTRIAKPSADLLDMIYLCESRQDWYRAYARETGLPEVTIVGSAAVSDDPAAVAARLRELLDFNLETRRSANGWQGALRLLIDRVEELGILVMVNGVVGANSHRKLKPAEFRGFAMSDPIAPLIFINGADTKAAQIFTLAHELAHLCLGESALSDASMKTATGPDDEIWCNKVAAEFLLPLDDFRQRFGGGLDVENLQRLAARYRVSTLVVLKRAFDAKLVGWDEFRARYDDELARLTAILDQQRAESTGGNYYNTQRLRLSQRFARAVVSSTAEGSTTYRDAYELLGTRKHATFETLAHELGA